MFKIPRNAVYMYQERYETQLVVLVTPHLSNEEVNWLLRGKISFQFQNRTSLTRLTTSLSTLFKPVAMATVTQSLPFHPPEKPDRV